MGIVDRMKGPCVYIMASKRNGALYVGVTSNIEQRVWQHKNESFEGWSKLKNAKMLVWYESHDTMANAIAREKSMKRWARKWKMEAIENTNPNWDDLAESWF